jgi:hypothetical protein
MSQSNPDRLHHVDRDTFRAIAQQPGINTETLRTGTTDTIGSLERLQAANLIVGNGAGEATTWQVDAVTMRWPDFAVRTLADQLRAFDAYAREVMGYRPPAGKPGHSVQEWQTEVISGGTRLGYDAWVQERTSADIVARINAGEVVTASFGTGGVKIQDSRPHSGKEETIQERYDRLNGGNPPYGSAGGSSGDHMIALARRIADGRGDDLYTAATQAVPPPHRSTGAKP